MPAPGLRETAEIWWDADQDPVVEWDEAARHFDLVDVASSANRLLLWAPPQPVDTPEVVARALAEGLAACDFPPTADGVSPARAETTLRVAGVLPTDR